MSYQNPILTGGQASNQTIWEGVDEARHAVGTMAALEDGRCYAYACNRGPALAAGVVAQAGLPSADFDELAVNTAAIGDTSVTITPTGTATFAAQELVGGYLEVSDDTGEGSYYRITSNPATVAATAFALGIEPIRVAFAAATTVTVLPNLYSAVVIADSSTSLARTAVGVSNSLIAIGSTTPQYFWMQTRGPCSVLTDATVSALSVGEPAQMAAAVDGAVEPRVEAAAIGDPQVGRCLALLSIDTEYALIDLQL